MTSDKRHVRGIRSPAPPGHVPGNLGGKEADPYWVSLYELSVAISDILTGGTGKGQGGGFHGGTVHQLQPLDGDLTAISALSTTGIAVRTGNETWATRTLIAGTGISITNPAGIAGDITITNTAPSSGGTVTSVDLVMPSAVFDVAGGPITTSGTFTVTFDTQTANRVFAGPTSGGAATPTFRSLVAADIPDLSATYQPLDADLTAIAALSTTGFAVRTAANTWALRTMADTARTAWTNPGGVAGNASVDLILDTITAGYSHFASTDRLWGRDAAGAGAGTEIALGAGLSFSGADTIVVALSASPRLLGRTTAGAGVVESISVDATLTLTALTLGRAALTGDITASAASNATTLATVNANVGTFGDASHVPQITVNAKGLTTAVTSVAIAITSGGVTDFNEAAQDATGAMVGASLVYVDATPLLARAALTGDITAPQDSNVTTLATVNANVGTFGDATHTVTVTVNGKGLATAAASVSIAIPSTQVTDFTEAAQDAVGAMVDGTLVYVDATPLLTRAALTGDITAPQASNVTTLATVNANVGTFGSATKVSTVTVNAKGLTTAASETTIAIPSTQVTDFNEAAQDAVGGILTDTAEIDFTYNDGANTITADIKTDSVVVGRIHFTATARLLGRTTAAAGGGEEISVGTGLTLSAGSLSVTTNTYVLRAGDTMTGALTIPAGAAATPSLNFTSATTRGLFSDTVNGSVGVSVGAVQIGSIGKTWPVLGSNISGATYRGVGGNAALQIQAEGLGNNQVQVFSDTPTDQGFYSLDRARGTIASPTVPATSDLIGTNLWRIWNGSGAGTGFSNAGRLVATVTETSTVDTTHLGMRVSMLLCPIGSGTETEIIRLEHATGFSMFGANPVIDQNRTHILRSYTTAAPPTLVVGGLTFDSTYNAPVYGGATTIRQVANGRPLVTTPSSFKLLYRLSVGPSQKLEYLIRDIYSRLSAAGLLAKLKGLWVLADPFSEFAAADGLINWITPGTGDMTVSGTVTYTAGQGRTGDGTTGTLSTAQTQATFGLSQNDAAWGVDIRTANSSAKSMVGTTVTNSARMSISNASTVATRVNDTTNDTFTPGAYTGLFQFWRAASTGYQWSLNGAAGTTITRTSTGINGTLNFLSSPVFGDFSDGQIRLGFMATGWTDADALALHNIFKFWWFAATGTTVANLPSTANLMDRFTVTDALAPVLGTAVVGGGAVTVPVYWNGTTWAAG